MAMPRILLLTTTTGYQTRMFAEAAARLGVEILFATDRCHVLTDPWADGAIPVRFADEQAGQAGKAIVAVARQRHIDGVLAVGDQPPVLAARVAAALGLPGNPPAAAQASRNKLATRERFREAGLTVPWFRAVPFTTDPARLARYVPFPCVVKPLALSGSRGVIRADDAAGFVAAFERLRRLLLTRDVQGMRDPANDRILVEQFIPGHEFALEGVLECGRFQALALFDKPDPLDGPFFEETIYVTPAPVPARVAAAIEAAVAQAIAALGLFHGPIHAECRVNGEVPVVLEVAARPIGGLCARSLAFVNDQGERIPFEELLLRHAAGEPASRWRREDQASGVMMIPIPRAGIYRAVEGVEEALEVRGIEDIRIAAKPDQPLVPLPEGASYLGFIFARGDSPDDVVAAIRSAHARLRFRVDAYLPVAPERGSAVVARGGQSSRLPHE